MHKKDLSKPFKKLISRYSWWLIVMWSLLIAALLYRDLTILNNATQNLAIREARANFQKDEAFRFWAATHGGFYVPVDERTPPNPYLSHVPERDIKTPSGKELTLMNPAYALRQLNEEFSENYGIAGHITSLNPLRPENSADEWEINALNQFEKGITEVLEFTNIENQHSLRLMQPLITQAGCLKCHEHQGYHVGDIRGGVSISIPMEPYIKEKNEAEITHILSFLILWLLVLFGLIIGSGIIRKNNSKKDEIQKLLRESYDQLGKRVEDRTNDLSISNKSLHNEIEERINTEKALQKSEQKLKELNESLEKQNKELEEARKKSVESDRLKSAFLANMSHEIRTPMNGILGFSELLKIPNISNAQQLKYVDMIEKSGKRLLDTINNIIDISKIESGQMEIIRSTININEQTEYLYSFFHHMAEKKGLSFCYKDALPTNAANIVTDYEKLLAILTNIINNAIKYTEKGSIEFGYILKNNFIEFYVKDTGMGIAKEKQSIIFDHFIQADSELTRGFEGSGLGLSISKSYVELLGGKIWLHSEENKGSEFWFSLPIIPVEKKYQKQIIKKDKLITKKLNILIAEDDEASYLYLENVVNAYCQEIFYAKNGIEAIEICKENKNIDLILMDIKMPEVNGYEASKKIREFNEEVIIIAQTAFAFKNDKEKTLQAGCNDYITKPIDKNELNQLIIKYFDEKE